ncbi:MAG: DUF444 family protein [Thermaerobacter sp.]|nr:DUF444 family protein [Thermaerobacter sp.]
MGSWPPDDETHAAADKRRQQSRIREAIRSNLGDLVRERKILGSDGRHTVKLPMFRCPEFRIRFGWHDTERVGQAPGGLPGDTNGAACPSAQAPGMNSAAGGDGSAAEDETEDRVPLEEVSAEVFADLALPDLDPARTAPGAGSSVEVVGIGRGGLRQQWAKKSTLLANLRRNAMAGWPGFSGLARQDLRFWVSGPVAAEQGGAVVLAMMDTSGSMGTFEKYLAKSFFFWTVEFLRRNYPQVEIVFLAHDVRAREVDEETFFHRGASGGTVSSSVYRLALDILVERFPADRYNAYAFHFTDGGNLTSDNAIALETGARLASLATLFGYSEIHDSERHPSPLFRGFSQLPGPGLGVMLLHSQEDILRALFHFFGKSRDTSRA